MVLNGHSARAYRVSIGVFDHVTIDVEHTMPSWVGIFCGVVGGVGVEVERYRVAELSGAGLSGREGVVGGGVPACTHPYLVGGGVGPVALVADPVRGGAGCSGGYAERVEDFGVGQVGGGWVEQVRDVAVGVGGRGEVGGTVAYAEQSAALSAVGVGPVAGRVGLCPGVSEGSGGGILDA